MSVCSLYRYRALARGGWTTLSALLRRLMQQRLQRFLLQRTREEGGGARGGGGEEDLSQDDFDKARRVKVEDYLKVRKRKERKKLSYLQAASVRSFDPRTPAYIRLSRSCFNREDTPCTQGSWTSLPLRFLFRSSKHWSAPFFFPQLKGYHSHQHAVGTFLSNTSLCSSPHLPSYRGKLTL